MAITGEIGSSGLLAWSGIIQEDFLTELQGKRGYKAYREMALNEPVIGALLLAIEHAIRGVTWTFASDEGEEDPRLELLKEAKANLSHSWNDHIVEALTMLPFGYSFFEIVYERMDSKMLWRKFAVRGQDTLYKWEIDDTGGLAAFVQQAPPKYLTVTIPIEKCLLYRTRLERGNPEGRSILRTAYKAYYYLKNIQAIEAIGIERDLAGLPMIRLPEGATTGSAADTDSSVAEKVVRNVRNDEQSGIVLKPGWEFELLSTGGTRQFDTDKIISRYESRILMSSLAQFLMLGQEGVGSLALSRDSTDFFTMSVNATADIIGETFTKYVIPRLLKLNGQDPDGIRLEHSPAGDVDIEKISDFLQKVGANFLTWTAQDETWLRGAAGLPELDEEEIEAERERKQAVALEIARSGPQQPGEEPGRGSQDQPPTRPGQPGEQKMGAELYYAQNAPDDEERRKWENRYKRAWADYLERSNKRVIKGARGLKNG